MTHEMILGVVAGAGWGTFVGFLLGAAWLRSFILEVPDDTSGER